MSEDTEKRILHFYGHAEMFQKYFKKHRSQEYTSDTHKNSR
jgi:hypothetical protein